MINDYQSCHLCSLYFAYKTVLHNRCALSEYHYTSRIILGRSGQGYAVSWNFQTHDIEVRVRCKQDFDCLVSQQIRRRKLELSPAQLASSETGPSYLLLSSEEGIPVLPLIYISPGPMARIALGTMVIKWVSGETNEVYRKELLQKNNSI